MWSATNPSAPTSTGYENPSVCIPTSMYLGAMPSGCRPGSRASLPSGLLAIGTCLHSGAMLSSSSPPSTLPVPTSAGLLGMGTSLHAGASSSSSSPPSSIMPSGATTAAAAITLPVPAGVVTSTDASHASHGVKRKPDAETPRTD